VNYLFLFLPQIPESCHF